MSTSLPGPRRPVAAEPKSAATSTSLSAASRAPSRSTVRLSSSRVIAPRERWELPLDPAEHHGDVVHAAVLVGQVDEALGGHVEVRGAAHDLQHLLVGDHAGEAVGAEEEDVP